jgi:hypothetical protein
MPTAFKEWAAICRALATGRQDVILRKGGIVEPGGEFQLDHRRFLLMPTFLHQSAEQLIPEARDLLDGIDADRPPPGTVVLTHEADVVDALRIRSLDALAPFRSRHVWSDEVVAERFHRWKDGVHLLVVRVTPLETPLVLPWREDYGGCKSWVELG